MRLLQVFNFLNIILAVLVLILWANSFHNDFVTPYNNCMCTSRLAEPWLFFQFLYAATTDVCQKISENNRNHLYAQLGPRVIAYGFHWLLSQFIIIDILWFVAFRDTPTPSTFACTRTHNACPGTIIPFLISLARVSVMQRSYQ